MDHAQKHLQEYEAPSQSEGGLGCDQSHSLEKAGLTLVLKAESWVEMPTFRTNQDSKEKRLFKWQETVWQDGVGRAASLVSPLTHSVTLG